MKSIPIYLQTNGEISLVGEMLHLGDIRVLRVQLVDGFYVPDRVYRGYVKELNGYVMFGGDSWWVSPMQTWVARGTDKDGKRYLDKSLMRELQSEDEAIDHIKRSFVNRPVKQAGIARLA